MIINKEAIIQYLQKFNNMKQSFKHYVKPFVILFFVNDLLVGGLAGKATKYTELEDISMFRNEHLREQKYLCTNSAYMPVAASAIKVE